MIVTFNTVQGSWFKVLGFNRVYTVVIPPARMTARLTAVFAI
jgi:hypothetical protein